MPRPNVSTSGRPTSVSTRSRSGPELTIQLLGPVSAQVSGRPVELGARKPRAVFAMLAINAGEPVSVERLIDGVWGEEPPDTAQNALQVYVAGLRRSLGPAGTTLRTEPAGYRLVVAREAVDALAFERATTEARGAGRVDAWRSALERWSGDPFADLVGIPFATAYATRFRELRSVALEERIDAELAEGKHALLIAELERCVAEEPYRERFWRQLMLAQYRDGRQAEALATYQRARSTLDKDLGLEPGPALVALERAILQQDPALDLAGGRVGLGVRLPRTTNTLIGRQVECRAIAAAVQRERLVTLHGPGGLGKTRLALQVGDDVTTSFTDGIVFIDLSSVRDADLLLAEVARSVDATVSSAVLDAIAARIGAFEVLLILDNLEQIADAGAAVARLLKRVPEVHILATSRTVLGLSNEHIIRVDPLTADEAVELFSARASGRSPATDTVMREIAERLDRLPLAIEIAAAACRTISPKDVLARLERDGALPSGPGDLPDRQRTLEATMAWSYRLLRPAARTHLIELSVFESRFTLTMASAVFGQDLAIPELVDASMLDFDGTDYRMLQTVRDFVATIDEAATGSHDRADRHADWIVSTLLAAERQLHSEDELAARAELAAIFPDIRRGLARLIATARHEDVARCLVGTSLLWYHQGLFVEYAGALDAALSGVLSPAVKAETMVMRGAFAKIMGNEAMGRQLLEEGVAALRPLAPDSVALVNGLCHLAAGAAESGQREVAFNCADEAVVVARRCADPGGLPMALDLSGYVARTLGDSDRALRASLAAVAAGDRFAPAQRFIAQAGLAAALAAAGRRDEAIGHAWQAVALAERLGSPTQLAETIVAVGSVFRSSDTPPFAPYLARSIAIYLACGAMPSVLDGGMSLASLIADADAERASQLLGAIVARARSKDDPRIASLGSELRDRLGVTTYSRLHADGASLDDDGFARLASAVGGTTQT